MDQLHLDLPGPTPATGDGFQPAGLPDAALAALLKVAGPGVDVPLLTIEARHLGGALAPGARAGGAVSALEAAYALFSGGITVDAESRAAVHACLDDLAAALAPWRAPISYRNFTERREDGHATWLIWVNGFAGTGKASAKVAAGIRNNPKGWYANLHTSEFPGGAVRGQLHRGGW
ncbi:CHRD domain-containing protein [Nonomuraea angiospora]|uniref:CHRD domain-containing protein n=1 Tax=Nonomuraea angiospora TaxID=46172 RepID=UPI00340B775D